MPTLPTAIGDALFTKTQQRVLGLLYVNPDQTYYLNEIVRWAGMGKGTIKRELEKLRAVDLLTVQKIGNQIHYQANKNSPIFTELYSITQKTFGVLDIVKAALVSLLPRLSQAFIYGSIAKGTERANSDIDIMLVGDELLYSETIALLDNAEQQLERTINPTLLSPQEFIKRVNAEQNFISQVMEQPKLWIKEP